MANPEAPPKDATRKPTAGWTRTCGLDTESLDYTDSVSADFYELEREAVFRPSWLHVGRVEQVPRTGSYFTRELPVLGTSIIVVRGKDGTIRAFHNMCSHRGNKLVWEDNPRNEVRGSCRQFVCKYHGWRYDLEGSLTHLRMQEWFFDPDPCSLGLTPVNCDVWAGFIFVNAETHPPETLREFLGPLAPGLERYPFDRMTQRYGFRAEVEANWKVVNDAFQESYHGATLHHRLSDSSATGPIERSPESYFELHGRHSTWSVVNPNFAKATPRPTAMLFRSSLIGPLDRPDIGLEEMPPALNPSKDPTWVGDLFHVFPNTEIVVWATNIFVTYNYWPLSVDRMIFDTCLHMVPPRTASERLAQEYAAATFKEFALQDVNLLEATHSMLKSGAKTRFPICDEEVQIRNNHRNIQAAVDRHIREQRP